MEQVINPTNWEALVGTLGFPIALAFILLAALFFFVRWYMADTKEREEKMQESIANNAVALTKVAETIEVSNEVNKELSETNRHLVEKMEDKLTNIDGKVDKILDKM